jgi:hypothetical protein
VDDHQDETSVKAGQVLPPGELSDRLSRRWTAPLGVIDVRHPQQRYASTAGWVTQRLPLFNELIARYGIADRSPVGGQELVIGHRLPEQMAAPSYASRSFSPTSGHQSDSGMRTEPLADSPVGNLSSGKVRVSRKPAPLSPTPGLAPSLARSSAEGSANSPADLQQISRDSLPNDARSAESPDEVSNKPLKLEPTDRSFRVRILPSSRQSSETIARQVSPSPLTLQKKPADRMKGEGKQPAPGRPSEHTTSQVAVPESARPNVSGAPASANQSDALVPPVMGMRLDEKAPETHTRPPIHEAQSEIANALGAVQTPDQTFDSLRAGQLILRKVATDKSDESHPFNESWPSAFAPITPQEPAARPAQERTSGKLKHASTESEGTKVSRSVAERPGSLPLAKLQSPPPVIQRKSSSDPSDKEPSSLASSQPSRYEQWFDRQATQQQAAGAGQNHQPLAVKEIRDNPSLSLRPNFVWRKSASQSAAAERLPGLSGSAPAIARQVNSSTGSTPSESSSIVAPPPATEQTSGGVNVGAIIQEVIRVISRNLEVERERRG